MSSFTKAHAAIIYDAHASLVLKKDHWRNLGDFCYYLGDLGSDEWIAVPAGMLSDGASVPFPVNALIPAWGSYAQAVILHDYLCNTYYKLRRVNDTVVQVPITRKDIDAILAEAMVVLNVPPSKQRLINFGVDLYRCVKRPVRPVSNPKRVALELAYDANEFAY